MVEAGANEVTEEETLKAMQFAHDEIKKIVAVILDLPDASKSGVLGARCNQAGRCTRPKAER